jgi:hypothetical protein
VPPLATRFVGRHFQNHDFLGFLISFGVISAIARSNDESRLLERDGFARD